MVPSVYKIKQIFPPTIYRNIVCFLICNRKAIIPDLLHFSHTIFFAQSDTL